MIRTVARALRLLTAAAAPGTTTPLGSPAMRFADLGGDRRADVVTIADRRPFVVFGGSDRPPVPLAPARGFLVDDGAEPAVPPTGLTPGTRGYVAVAVVHDLDRSGRDDLLVGAPLHSEHGTMSSGAVSLFLVP